MARYEDRKRKNFTVGSRDVWGDKKMPSYTSKANALSDSYRFGWCKAFRDKLRRVLKHGMRQILQKDLKERLNDT